MAVDRRRAADLGVRMSTIGSTLRLAVSGDDEISFFKEGQEQYPVKMRVLESQRRDPAQIGRLTVPAINGPVRIDNIARVERGLGPSALQSLRPAVQRLRVGGRRARARARRRHRTTCAPCSPISACPRRCRSGCRGQSQHPRRDDREHDHGDRPCDDLRLHGARGAVRELRPADSDHAGDAACRCPSRSSPSGDRPDAQPLERARDAPAASGS